MNKIILIIDDDLTFQKAMSTKLMFLNYKVIGAINGDDGFNKAISEKPDLILLDVRMPKLDGMAFLKKLRSVKDIPEIPVLITSNLSNMDYISEGVALGVRGYIVKSNESLDNIANGVEAVLNPKTRP